MNIRVIRKKIKSIGNVKKITRAMQLVSAVKMKKTQSATIEALPYQQALERMIKKVSTSSTGATSSLTSKTRNSKDKKLNIVVATNKGLCGSFNMNLFRLIVKSVVIKDNDFVVVGKKGVLFLARVGYDVIADFSSSNPLSSVSALFDFVLDKYVEGEYSEVNAYYNQFISAFRFHPKVETLLPVRWEFNEINEKKSESLSKYEYEPKTTSLVDELLKSYIEEKIRFIILQSEAGEHAARMLAMKNATDSATDLLFNLTLIGNKLRQEKITNELLDMITAKESVETS